MKGYLVGEDANGDLCIWRETDADPVAIIAQRDLRGDFGRDLWNRLVALIEGAS